MVSKLRLHSHLFQSPISRNQEVSAFGGEDGGLKEFSVEINVQGDNWIIECGDSSDKYWTREKDFKLKHADTGAYLSHNPANRYGQPLDSHSEVFAVKKATINEMWKTMEGIFIADRATQA